MFTSKILLNLLQVRLCKMQNLMLLFRVYIAEKKVIPQTIEDILTNREKLLGM